MSAPLPRVQHGAVLAGVKATPSGWPPASPDPSSGRRPPAATGSGIQQTQVSTLSGDCQSAVQQRVQIGGDLRTIGWTRGGVAPATSRSVIDAHSTVASHSRLRKSTPGDKRTGVPFEQQAAKRAKKVVKETR